MATISHPTSKRVLKFRLKFDPNPNHLSIGKMADSTVINRSKTTPTCSDQKSLKIADGPFVIEKINGTKPGPVFNPSHKKSPKIKFGVKSSNISIEKEGDADSIVAGETNANASEPKCLACKQETLLVVDNQPTQESVVMNSRHVPEAAMANKIQKKQLFSDSVALPRHEIEEDIAAFEALSGGKRLRRPKKRDPPRSVTDQRRLDHLFPSFEYLGFH